MSSGTNAQTEGLPDAGALIAGRYRVERCLGRGGMGAVYAVYDTSLQRQVALKRMLSGPSATRALTVSFMREYHLLAQLRHPRIIQVFDYGIDAGSPYYTMELLLGDDLRALAPLPETLVCRYLRDVASSLALLHVRRMLHRDLSPSNVRRLEDGRCKLLDFGTVVPFGLPPNIAGTPPFIAPEALRDTALGPRSDLFALGALGYFLLTGKHAFPASNLEQLHQLHEDCRVVRPSKLVDVGEPLDALLISLLSLDPSGRPESAAEVIERLNAAGDLPADNLPGVAASFVVSSRLIGRQRELTEIERSCAQALASRGGAIVVEAENGAGRTRFLAEAVRSAQLRGFTVVETVARGSRGTETLTKSLLHALERAAPDVAVPLLRSKLPSQPELEPPGLAPAANGEARARLQASLATVFCEVARNKPLLIAVDDIDLADDFSAALIAALARAARELPLMIVATRQRESHAAEFSALKVLSQDAVSISLGQLSRAQTAELVVDIFGDVPHVERVADWLHRAGHGNPGVAIELAQHLIARGIVRFLEGTWALPSDPITEALPAGLSQALELRLLRLSAEARALAELMSVRRGGLTLTLATAATSVSPEALVTALDELVSEGIVELAGEEYVFAQQVMRQVVQHSLKDEREAALHAGLADALLASERLTSDVQLEAGWHLVHTRDELRGAELLAKVAPGLLNGGLHIAAAIPALERALSVFERHGKPLAARLRLQAELVLAGYVFDFRVGVRYGEQTVAELFRCSGLALMQRLARYWPRPVATVLAVTATALRRYFLPARLRGPHPIIALRLFGRVSIALMGLRATALDAKGTAELRELIEWLDNGLFFPFNVRATPLSARAFALQPLGREAELSYAVARALAAVNGRRNPFIQESDQLTLLTGLLLVDGINESYRERSRALERAASLEALGTLLATACAKRVRMIYHLVRGERDAAELERRSLELIAIQGGTTWQVEWFAAPVEGLVAAAMGDVMAIKRALDKLDALLVHVPSLEPLRDAVQIGYHYQRNEPARVVELGERFIAAHPPRTVIGWGPTYAMITDALASCGQPARAVEIAEDALAQLSQEDLEYFVMYAPLQCTLAWAYAALGDLEAATQLISSVVQRLDHAGEQGSVALVHSLRARIAGQLGSRQGLQDAIRDLRDSALRTNNAALVMLARRWELAHLHAMPSPAPPALNTEVRADVAENSPLETLVTAFVGRGGSERNRYNRALALLVQASNAAAGYLYLKEQRVATHADPAPPPALDDQMAALFERDVLPSFLTIELPANDSTSRSNFYVVGLHSGDSRAAVALREGAEPLCVPGEDLLVELRAALR